MMVVGPTPADGYGVYVGATNNLRRRMQQHRRPSSMLQRVSRFLELHDLGASDIHFVTLDMAPSGPQCHAMETLWTLRATQSGCDMLNAPNVAGSPARTKAFFGPRANLR